jgi:hypothetical protein
MKPVFKGRRFSFILANFIVLIVISSLFFFDIKLQSDGVKENSAGASLELSGKVLDAYASAGKIYDVEIMLGDQPAGSLRVKNAETFSLKLYKDRHYLLHISEDNGNGKMISVYTHLPSNDDQLHHFSFVASLGTSAHFSYPASPAALIAYDHELRDFSYSEEITSHFSRKLYSQRITLTSSAGFNH